MFTLISYFNNFEGFIIFKNLLLLYFYFKSRALLFDIYIEGCPGGVFNFTYTSLTECDIKTQVLDLD